MTVYEFKVFFMEVNPECYLSTNVPTEIIEYAVRQCSHSRRVSCHVKS